MTDMLGKHQSTIRQPKYSQYNVIQLLSGFQFFRITFKGGKTRLTRIQTLNAFQDTPEVRDKMFSCHVVRYALPYSPVSSSDTLRDSDGIKVEYRVWLSFAKSFGTRKRFYEAEVCNICDRAQSRCQICQIRVRYVISSSFSSRYFFLFV